MSLWVLICAVMLEKEWGNPKLFPQSWEHTVVQMSWYSEALRVETKGSGSPEKKARHHNPLCTKGMQRGCRGIHIIPSAPNFTLETVQSGSVVPLATDKTQIHQFHSQAENHNSSLQKPCLHCCRV
ncbi:hypothetical protein AMECASPLE_030569 [Ameca splendens]|uniref:Uncharacterized protein n=1 Tax=Ameca splendens TaxID=208324 RepID=A0ABV0YHU2_9TELE